MFLLRFDEKMYYNICSSNKNDKRASKIEKREEWELKQ